MKHLACTLFLLSFIFQACTAPAPFHQNTMPNDAAKIRSAVNQIQLPSEGPLNATGSPLAILQTHSPRSAVAMDPRTGKVLWKQPTPEAASRYVIAGQNVVFLDRSAGITALDIRSGKQVWTFPVNQNVRFLGISGAPNGKTAFVTTFQPAGDVLNMVSQVTMLSETGREIWTLEANGRMGRPLMTNNVVIVPYRNQQLVFLDTTRPLEMARILIPQGSIRYMESTSMGIFFGDGKGMYRLSENVLEDIRKSPWSFKTDIQNVEHRFSQDLYDPVTTDYSAYDVRSIHGTWMASDRLSTLYQKRFVLQMFKYLLGFHVNEKDEAVLQWAVMHDHSEELLGALARKDFLFYAKTDGSLESIRMETGERVWRTEPIGGRFRGITFDLGNMDPPSTALGEAPLPLLDALTAIANDPDARFPLAKRFAIDALAVVGGAGVGRLIRMLTNPASSPELREKASQDLIARPDPNGVPLYLSLLQQPFDYIKNTRPQAVEVMARVLGNLKTKEAVPTLLQLLGHPGTTERELLVITEALLEIGDPQIIRPFREFLLAYRADPAFAQDVHTLQKMAEALFKLGGPAERQVLVFLTEDDRTLPRLREFIVRLFEESRKTTKTEQQ